ncbi:MAG: hypothetical protein ACMUIU_03475 [bacterium]
MKRRVLPSLFASLIILVIVTVIVVAQSPVQKIELNIEGYVFPMMPTPEPPIPASANLCSNIIERFGKYYLSTFTGTITIGEVSSEILVKPLKTSDELEYYEFEYIDIDGYKVKYQQWGAVVEANISGDRFMGFAGWGMSSHELWIEDLTFSYLNIYGIKEGQMISCEMAYPPPYPLSTESL